MTPQQFVHKWRGVTLKERSASQEHFIDLCHLVNHPTPAAHDPTGERFTFERGADKQTGGQGWADVWYRGRFAWEYKGKHKDLDAAYNQILLYREALENPPLMVVSDMERILIHTNFTNTVKQVHEITLDDLLTREGMDRLRALFYKPEQFRAAQTTEHVTEEAARQFARLAEQLRKWGEAPDKIAHFLIRLLFCLFAEDIGLLPENLFSQLVARTRGRAPDFAHQLQQLFNAMQNGGWFGVAEIAQFDGALFDGAAVLELDSTGLDILARVSGLDWSSIEPSILGTLFQRSLDPALRAQLGAHYTSKEDILLIVEPVLMAPLRRGWAKVEAQARELAAQRDNANGRKKTNLHKELTALLTGFAAEIAAVRVLDPGCGSANFLYVALRLLLDLEKEVITLAGDLGVGRFIPAVSPAQLYGIELNEYAYELAQTTVWIGYIQWLHENGFGHPEQPILKPLNNIKHMDAILATDENGRPVEPTWPEADVIVGNPPFLGGNRIRQELGDQYVDSLFALYDGRIPAFADLVCYWFEKARYLIETGSLNRAGLLATNSIRSSVNRQVLERIKEIGDIFMAWSDRPWILDGAAVRVSMIGFDNGGIQTKTLDGNPTETINADLSSSVDVTAAEPLTENSQIAFVGSQKIGSFDIPEDLAKKMIASGGNPNLRPNSDVVKPSVNASDVMGRSRRMWIIDFGTDMPMEEAAEYEVPFEFVRENVKPDRDKNRDPITKRNWWLHGRARPALREAMDGLQRYLITPRVAKHRVFDWLSPPALPDHKLYVFCRSDDYFFGVLHSRIHETWTLHTCSWHGVGNDPVYKGKDCFETFPLPWPPGKEPGDDPRVAAIATAARALVEKRDAWLNPPGASEAELKKRTLTNLYNQRPTWLDLAHKKLDTAVLAAYGWSDDLTDEQILERLLALNLERARKEG
ncbi:MAG: class I SAM-dependent DNA methyltransferase [Ardenticatenaceae bacterium]|nr:class I SAM-dependent DNA methyltransferase [Ardenticatenaceae bacterium]MCB8948064.1 class I SAM-dependent DNA methyltransferase [Ardenticatenaceae bacterium]